MKIVIAGSRHFTNYECAEKFIDDCLLQLCINEEVIVLSGTCRGADKLGELYASKHSLTIKFYPPEWSKYGKGAGVIRNQEMAEYCDVIICFWDGKSKGTKALIDYGNKLKKPLFVYPITPNIST